MATGKELVRMMETSVWEDFVSNSDCFCSAQIFDRTGKVISKNKAKTEYFCHAKILFRGLEHEYMVLLERTLRIIASTRSESMNSYTYEYYGFQEIIVC